MGWRRIRLLIGLVGLLELMFANTVVAALVVEHSASAPPFGDTLLERLGEEVLASAVTCPASALPGPDPLDPPPEKRHPSILRHIEALTPGGVAASNSSSPCKVGCTGAALAAALAAAWLPKIDPRGSVPPKAAPIVPTGCPLSLLRPV